MKYLDNKTKIIATIGPATSSREMLKKIIETGVNVCRLNFSHGTHADHQEVLERIRSIDEELEIHTGILADLQGPKIRIGDMGEGREVIAGDRLQITTNKDNPDAIWINYKDFPRDVQQGENILLDDGKLKFEIVSTDGKENVEAKVIFGGILKSRKGVNLPDTKISMPCLTEKDLVDLEFVLKYDIPWIGLSFVRSADDVLELKSRIAKAGKTSLVVAKIEKPEAVQNLDAIIDVADALMVARGDLGVEIPLQEVPLIQKSIVKQCRNKAKPVIIATQMMESMIDSFAPSRAEVNDVANAVLDGADAVMLSGETSVGKYPVEVVSTMMKIVMRIEQSDQIYNTEIFPEDVPARFITDSICDSAAQLAKTAHAKGIVTMTFSGYTAFKTASYRPNGFIFVFTANRKILDMLSLVWGVKSFYYNEFVSTDHTIDEIKLFLKEYKYAEVGDYVIHIASMPIARKGMSNMLRISHIK